MLIEALINGLKVDFMDDDYLPPIGNKHLSAGWTRSAHHTMALVAAWGQSSPNIGAHGKYYYGFCIQLGPSS